MSSDEQRPGKGKHPYFESSNQEIQFHWHSPPVADSQTVRGGHRSWRALVWYQRHPWSVLTWQEGVIETLSGFPAVRLHFPYIKVRDKACIRHHSLFPLNSTLVNRHRIRYSYSQSPQRLCYQLN